MSKRFIIIAVFMALAIGLGLYFMFGGTSSSQPAVSTAKVSPNIESVTTQPKAYAQQEIALHNSAKDCWTIVSGKVYNITSYVPNHPGGLEILRACGTDGTLLFTNRTTSAGEKIGSGTPHSDAATDRLSSMQIGVLAP